LVVALLSVCPEAGLFFFILPAMIALPRSRDRREVKTMDSFLAISDRELLENLLVSQVLILAKLESSTPAWAASLIYNKKDIVIHALDEARLKACKHQQ
jgi:hypothetical protein